MKFPILLLLLFGVFAHGFSATLHVGPGRTYAGLSAAAAAVQAGDTILIHQGTYPGGIFLGSLQGQSGKWITIKNAPGETVIFQGGTNAIQFSDPAYLLLQGLILQGQTGNGINIDDGGSYNTPAHHVQLRDCIFRDMNASGNNDLLKLSGLNDFDIRNCQFLNGSAGGSGIDMVGCHDGIIEANRFENMGTNAIQAKGGTARIQILRNWLQNAGSRALNLGGSTGLEFFRPIDAPYEAADLQVYANVFIGSEAAVAYVGSVRVDVANNTIVNPATWIIRILQETVNPARFLACGDNSFRNNLVIRDGNLRTDINIGPNTRPESFTFANNLWFHSTDGAWSGPSLPATETNALVQVNPRIVSLADRDFHPLSGSPLIGKGQSGAGALRDFDGKKYADPPAIGAFEGAVSTGLKVTPSGKGLRVFPNPLVGGQQLLVRHDFERPLPAQLVNAAGCTVRRFLMHPEDSISTESLPAGAYVLRTTWQGQNLAVTVVIQ